MMAPELIATAGGGVRVARRIMTALLATIVTLVVLGLAVRIYMGRDVEDRLAEGEAISITELRSPLPKASFLACPTDYCFVAGAVTSPVFDLPWDRLHDYWTEVISGEKRTSRVVADPDARRFVYIQHSPVFRFPDIITVEFVPLGANRSSIAIYSRSRYGQYDFEKNRKRVEKWLALLERVARPATTSQGRAQ
jgi:Protein of unknown function (DUF1499)